MVRILRIFVVMTLLVVVLAPPATAAHEGPIRGSVMGEHTAPDFTDPDCIAAGYVWRFTSSGEGKAGQMSHLGRIAAYDLTHCTAPGPDGIRSVGRITFTAANGDELIVEHTMLSEVIGDFPSGPVYGFTFVGTWKAVGGTGRFIHATGAGTLDGAGDIPDGMTVFDGIPDGLMLTNLTGTIAYDRSGK